MKVAVIGCGTMGRTHALQLVKIPGIQLVGVCSTRMETAQALADQCGTQAFCSFEDLIDQTDPDAISICLPTPLHKEYVLKTAALGKHIICEKPIANSLRDAREMIDVCRQRNVRLFIGHVVRFFPSYMNINSIVANGAIGKPMVVHARRAGPHPGEAKAWYNQLSDSGGVIMDLMIHDIDYLRGLLGEVKTVYAFNRKTDRIDYALVTLRFESGAMANLEGFWGFPGPFETKIDISGDKGTICSDSGKSVALKVRKSRELSAKPLPKEVAVPETTGYDPYFGQLQHFLECIRNGQEPIVTAEDSLKAMEIALAAIESVRTSQPIDMKLFLTEK